MTGGFAGLMGAAIVGPRTGRFDAAGRPMAMPGHNAALVVLGTFILWVGWYGFNPGSMLAIAGSSPAEVVGRCAVTTTPAAAGGVTAMIINYSLYHVWDLIAVCNGCLAGLVSITAGCPVVEPYAAVIAGAGGAFVIWSSGKLLLKLGIDDPGSRRSPCTARAARGASSSSALRHRGVRRPGVRPRRVRHLLRRQREAPREPDSRRRTGHRAIVSALLGAFFYADSKPPACSAPRRRRRPPASTSPSTAAARTHGRQEGRQQRLRMTRLDRRAPAAREGAERRDGRDRKRRRRTIAPPRPRRRRAVFFFLPREEKT